MVYSRLGTKMQWWARHNAYKARNMLRDSEAHELFAMYPPTSKGPTQSAVPINYLTDYARLLNVLIQKRPELKPGLDKPGSRAHLFLTRQLHWMSKGYKETVAFNKTEEELAKNLAEARSHSAMLYEIGTSTSMRSFLDYYQQVAEYEGRLKVKKLVKDLPKYLRASKEYDIFKDHSYINDWESFVAKVKIDKVDTEQAEESFINKAETLMEYHREKANKYDGLQGLSDNMILWSARDAYRHLKKTNAELLKDLEALGVKINKDNDLDVSAVKSEDLKQAILKNPMIKLIFQDANPEYIHDPPKSEPHFPEASPGKLEPPEIKWDSENPYKQIYGRLDLNQIESQEERIERLKKLWHHSRKVNTKEDQFKLQQDAVKALRNVRMKVDQILVSEGHDVVFPKNKAYSKDELMLTHRIDIDRMGKFLATSSEKLMETEYDRTEHAEIMKMVEKTEIIEYTEPIGSYRDYGMKLSEPQDEDDISLDEDDDGVTVFEKGSNVLENLSRVGKFSFEKIGVKDIDE